MVFAVVHTIKLNFKHIPLYMATDKKNQVDKHWILHVLYCLYGPLARYIKLRVAHAPGMPGTFTPPPRFSDPDMHHGTCVTTCVTHVSWCMPLNRGFLWSWWRGKRSRNSRRTRNPQCYVSGKRPMRWPGHKWWILDKHNADLTI